MAYGFAAPAHLQQPYYYGTPVTAQPGPSWAPPTTEPVRDRATLVNAAMERYDESQREEQRPRERAQRQMETIEEYMSATESEGRPSSSDILVHVATALKTLRRVTSEARQQHDVATQALRDSDSTVKLKYHAEDWEEFQEAVDRSESIAETLQAMIEQYNQYAKQFGTTVTDTREDEFPRRPAPPATAPQLSLDADLLRLPKHELPKFAGTCVDWPVFWNQFKIAVYDRALASIHKFVYMRSCLSGEALDLVKALLIVDSSYSTALTLLRQRFEDTTVLLRDHIDGLLNAPTVQPNIPASLRRLVSLFQDRFTGVENAGVSTGYLFLTHLLTGKLDGETRRAWELAQMSTAKFEEFRRSLDPPVQDRPETGDDCDGSTQAVSVGDRNPAWTSFGQMREKLLLILASENFGLTEMGHVWIHHLNYSGTRAPGTISSTPWAYSRTIWLGLDGW